MNLTPNWAAHERRIQTGPIVRLSLEPDPERLYPEADWQRRRGVGGADAGGDVHGLRVGTGTGQEGRGGVLPAFVCSVGYVARGDLLLMLALRGFPAVGTAFPAAGSRAKFVAAGYADTRPAIDYPVVFHQEPSPLHPVRVEPAGVGFRWRWGMVLHSGECCVHVGLGGGPGETLRRIGGLLPFPAVTVGHRIVRVALLVSIVVGVAVTVAAGV